MLLMVAIHSIIILSISLFFGKSCGREGGPLDPKKIFTKASEKFEGAHEIRSANFDINWNHRMTTLPCVI